MKVQSVSELGADVVAELRSTYEEAFPPELRVPFDDLLVDHVLGFVDADGPVGLGVVRDLPDGSAFLRYFVAVRKGSGSGTRMWAALEDWARDRDAPLLLLDVEDPAEEVGDADETAIRERRVVFYERNGAQVLPIVGYAPDHGSAMHGHAPHMRLLVAELGLAPDARQPLPEERLREVLLLVLGGRYGYPADHPDVRRMLADSGL